jgi:photosystem II stability/assembly factor-like uncharacterized protein
VVTFKVDLLSPRARRGLSLIVLAVTVIVVSSVVYLHPSPPPKAVSPLPTPSPLPLSRLTDDVSYDFVTSAMGWALVVTTGTGRTPFSVLRTVDGTKHWQKQLTGSQDVPNTVNPLSVVEFFDSSNGFVQIPGLNDLVYRTTDGGAHWHPMVLPGPGGAVISFSDPSNGWVLVSASPTDQTVNLYATTDGGSTWQRLPDPPGDACTFGSCELFGIGLRPAIDRRATITFRGPSEGWIRGQADPKPHVYSSSDGGRSWNRHNLPIPKDGLAPRAIASVHLLPGSGVLAYLDEGSGPDFPVTSFDGGASWRSVTTPPTYGRGFIGGSISFQDAYHWWNTDGSELFKSSDAGQTWSVSSLGILGFFSYQFIDSQHVWGLYLGTATPPLPPEPAGQGLAVTADGGLHWTQASVPDPA